ncbi:hydrolase 76 protein [Aspergillus nanangensis]|uniref:Mannan endo-1,6-alpha-mannosidase n=1 Tax=Aspergillus nanangensis TaxID=2582783 RepID=A0AAD4CG72_ASPNN|nr:hydrolase 76 protein [Aspergillus nanangensis]
MRTQPKYVFSWVLHLCAICVWFFPASAIELDLQDPKNIKNVAGVVAKNMVSVYTGNNPGDVPGNLPDPYYWWEAGAFFGTLINYWYYTGDTTYNNITTQAILHQASPSADFMPPNQTRTEGNDDQAFWAFTAMRAAELGFANPPDDQPSWVALVQAVFNEQTGRWNTDKCGGGLKWQLTPLNNGYTYRNAISTGCLFNMAARLARYTGNDTYAEWAHKAWDWVTDIGLVSDKYAVYDGTSDTNNCSDVNHREWSYNNGVFLHGAAHMWNHTKDDVWKTRIDGLLDAQTRFLSQNESSKNVFYEYPCEHTYMGNTCNTDQKSFKAYLARWMADSVKLAPWTRQTILSRLTPSAKAAAAQCVGGKTGTFCGMEWTTGKYDGRTGVGEQMSALEVIQAHLLDEVDGPMSTVTGGTSKGDGAAGTGPERGDDPAATKPITTGDRVGAAILTVVVAVVVIGWTTLMMT